MFPLPNKKIPDVAWLLVTEMGGCIFGPSLGCPSSLPTTEAAAVHRFKHTFASLHLTQRVKSLGAYNGYLLQHSRIIRTMSNGLLEMWPVSGNQL